MCDWCLHICKYITVNCSFITHRKLMKNRQKGTRIQYCDTSLFTSRSRGSLSYLASVGFATHRIIFLYTIRRKRFSYLFIYLFIYLRSLGSQKPGKAHRVTVISLPATVRLSQTIRDVE